MKSVKVLSDAVNSVVVLVEGRRYPGMVVQGDRLRWWAKLAQAGDAESVDILSFEIEQAVIEYDRVSSIHGLSLPGTSPEASS